MSLKPLLDEVPADLDLRLEIDDDLCVFLPPASLRLSGLRLGEPLLVDIHPLSLRLDSVGVAGEQQPGEDRPLAQVDSDGRIHLPFKPPRLKGRRVLLQMRQRGACREIHLLADPQ